MRPLAAIATGILFLASAAAAAAQAPAFTVTLDPVTNGRIQLTPPLPPDGNYPAGTIVTVAATADAGFAIDSIYFSVPGRFGQMYHEHGASPFAVTIDRDKRIGASFIDAAAVSHLTVTHDVVVAKPGVKAIKYDVYSPKGARNMPIIVIVHGGGWTANDEDIMRGLARELTRGGRFVVASLDYRWGGKEDGDATGNTMANLIEDVFGGIAHVMEHAAQYGGDATRIGVTGDSAGGHLAAAATLMTDKIGSRGFGRTAGVFEFAPTYLPRGKTVEQMRGEMLRAIKAGAPSYGVFSAARLNPYAADPADEAAWKPAIAPLSNIPKATERAVPQFLLRGTRDRLISNAEVTEFMDALVEAGQRVEYVQVGGAGHAFFDWKPNAQSKATFARFGVYYAAQMKAFFEATLY